MSFKNNAKVTCVFVHGWAMNSAVWEPCLPFLPEWVEVVRLDLPGHGSMASVGAHSIEDYLEAMMTSTRRPVVWVGWSLGGLALLKLASLYPERVAGLFLVATNPCFVRKPDWRFGVDEAIFRSFADSLERNVDTTIKRFLALQVKGSATAMKTIRQLQHALRQGGGADKAALGLGLDILAGIDLRQELTTLKCPMGWLLGGHDALVPVALKGELKAMNPNINVVIEEQAAHVPFISKPKHFADTLVTFIEMLQ